MKNERTNDPYYTNKINGVDRLLLLPRAARRSKIHEMERAALNRLCGVKHHNLTIIPMWYEREKENYNYSHPHREKKYSKEELAAIKSRYTIDGYENI